MHIIVFPLTIIKTSFFIEKFAFTSFSTSQFGFISLILTSIFIFFIDILFLLIIIDGFIRIGTLAKLWDSCDFNFIFSWSQNLQTSWIFLFLSYIICRFPNLLFLLIIIITNFNSVILLFDYSI